MTILDHADQRLQRYFADGWWDIYDGVPTAHDATITVPDIVISVALNSQLDTRTKVWHVWQERAAIEQALARIPSDLSLEADDIPWLDLHTLFERFCAIKHAKEAVTTKILHKKRPALIPIYDRFVGAYFQSTFDPQVCRKRGAPFLVAYMQCFRAELRAYRSELHALCAAMAKNGWSLTPVRLLEVLIWMENEPKGYYRERQ
jgi:hypothetical protein